MPEILHETFWTRPKDFEPILQELVGKKTLSLATAELLSNAVKERGKILIFGQADTGKTTLSDALTASIPLKSVLLRVSASERNLSRHGLVCLEESASFDFVRVDEELAQVDFQAPHGALVSLRTEDLQSAINELGEDVHRFSFFVEMKKVKDGKGKKTTRYVASVTGLNNGEYFTLENSYLDPWGEIVHKGNIETENIKRAIARKVKDVSQGRSEGIALGASIISGKDILFSVRELMRGGIFRNQHSEKILLKMSQELIGRGWDGVIVDAASRTSNKLSKRLEMLALEEDVEYSKLILGTPGELSSDDLNLNSGQPESLLVKALEGSSKQNNYSLLGLALKVFRENAKEEGDTLLTSLDKIMRSDKVQSKTKGASINFSHTLVSDAISESRAWFDEAKDYFLDDDPTAKKLANNQEGLTYIAPVGIMSEVNPLCGLSALNYVIDELISRDETSIERKKFIFINEGSKLSQSLIERIVKAGQVENTVVIFFDTDPKFLSASSSSLGFEIHTSNASFSNLKIATNGDLSQNSYDYTLGTLKF